MAHSQELSGEDYKDVEQVFSSKVIIQTEAVHLFTNAKKNPSSISKQDKSFEQNSV